MSSGSPSITSHALRLPDIVHLILESIVSGSSECPDSRMPDIETRRSLTALARTCQTLSDPSLDFLWRRLDSLKPLIRIFTGPSTKQLNTPPSPDKCGAINRHSHRIWELEVSDDLSLQFLQIMSFGHFSLPNLRLLKWCVRGGRDNIVNIRPLLSPRLVALDAKMDDEGHAPLLSFLKNYPLLCPDLRSVKLDLTCTDGMHNNSNTFILAISAAVVSHKNLECLVLSNPTSKPVLEQLLMTPTLKGLSLIGQAGSQDLHLSNVSIPPTRIPLQNIENIHLSIRHLDLMTDLLRPDHQRFRRIHLHVYGPPSNSTLQEFSNALATHPREDSLESIVLDHKYGLGGGFECSGVFEIMGRYFLIQFDAIRPLLSLRHLRELELHIFGLISVDDHMLAMMASSWPLLEDLKLYPLQSFWGVWENAKYLTLAGILPLLASCPKLRELSIQLDAREVPEEAPSDVCNREIKVFGLSGCPVDDPDRVTRFLRTHLPSVWTVLHHGRADTREYHDQWGKVQANLRG